MNITMKQLGAEAALKGAQRKTSGTVPTMSKAAPAPTSTPPTTSAQTPTIDTVKAQEESAPPDAENTIGKTPAQLAAEGKTKSSTEKIESISAPSAESEASKEMPPPSNFPPKEPLGSPSEKSTEAQVLDLKRTSTTTKQPSRLSEATPVEQSHSVLPDEPAAETEIPSDAPTTVDPETVEPAAEEEGEAFPSKLKSSDLPSSSSEVLAGSRPKSHRGSSVEEADVEEIRRIETENQIKEESEPEEAVADDEKEATVGSKLREQVKPQETKAKDEEAAGVSVGD